MIRTVADPGAQAVSSATLATKFLNTLRHEFQVAMALTGGVACPNVGWMTGHPEAEAVRLSDEKSSLPPQGRATLPDKYWPNIQELTRRTVRIGAKALLFAGSAFARSHPFRFFFLLWMELEVWRPITSKNLGYWTVSVSLVVCDMEPETPVRVNV